MKLFQDVRLVTFDLDDTTLPAGRDAYSSRLEADLKRCREKGILVMLNTGRHYKFLPSKVLAVLPPGPIGTINGACLVDASGKVLEKHPMTPADMNNLIQLSDENELGLGFKFEDNVVTYAYHDKFVEGYCHGLRRMKALVVDDCRQRTHHLQHGYPLGTFIVGDEKKIEALRERLPRFVLAWAHWKGYDAFLKDINKAVTVEAVLKREGLSWDNVMAFGDAGNDAPFIAKAKYGYAMANATPEAKAAAHQEAPPCQEDGVAQVLEATVLK
jgi:Cof subfamily protein (haloacid dehalogenase superfamily)